MPELFDKVRLKDGTIGTIAEVLEPGVAYMFEYETPDGPNRFDVATVYQSDIDATLPSSAIGLNQTRIEIISSNCTNSFEQEQIQATKPATSQH